MKTVWHWGSLSGLMLILFAAGGVIGWFGTSLQIPIFVLVIIGFVVGTAGTTLFLLKWDLWHFE